MWIHKATSARSSVGVDEIHPSMCSSTDETFGSPRASKFLRPESLCVNICGETPRFLPSAGGLLFPLQSWEDNQPTRKHNPCQICVITIKPECTGAFASLKMGTEEQVWMWQKNLIWKQSIFFRSRGIHYTAGDQIQTRSQSSLAYNMQFIYSGGNRTLEDKCGRSQWMFTSYM